MSENGTELPIETRQALDETLRKIKALSRGDYENAGNVFYCPSCDWAGQSAPVAFESNEHSSKCSNCGELGPESRPAVEVVDQLERHALKHNPDQ